MDFMLEEELEIPTGYLYIKKKISTALRSSASTTAMHILWSWMVSSLTTIGISAIPAGIFFNLKL